MLTLIITFVLLYYLKIGYNLSLFPVFILIKSKQTILTDLENCSSIQHVSWRLTWNKKLILIFIYLSKFQSTMYV